MKRSQDPDLLSPLRQKLPPARRRPAVPWPSDVLRGASGTDSETEVGELLLNALVAPQLIHSDHTTNQLSDL